MAMSAEQMQQMAAMIGQVVAQVLQQQGAAQAASTAATAPAGERSPFPKTQLNVKGFDNLETFPGGEEFWQTWSWKARIAVSAMHGDLADLMKEAEMREGKDAKEILNDIDDLEENYDHEKCIKASKELYSLLARYTGAEAAMIVRSVTGLDGVEAWGKLHASYSRRTMGRMFRVQRECMYPKPAKELGQLKNAIMQWEEKWKAMMAELGTDAKIPELWRMSALLEICP